MSAWETTADDVEIVLKAHNLTPSKEQVDQLLGQLDTDSIIDAVLAYTDFDDQCQSAFCEIELQLAEMGVVETEHRFRRP